eukprot:g7347.t1
MQVFAPFSYDGLSSRKWDLVVIEGFMGTVPAFIHEVRAANEKAVVMFFCLDTYPSMSALLSLDVDAFLTNSQVLLPSLRQIAPASSLLHLAADPEAMLKGPVDPRYDDNVVYLGQFKDTKHRLVETLTEVAQLGLSIYGNGWDNVVELRPFWRGVLPAGDIASLYSSAKVVLSTTETLQRGLGMVNNRVFEALSCGAAVVSDAFPAMEETFGDHVMYFRHPGDAARAVKQLLGNDTARQELGKRGRQLVSSKHTYASRVPTILATMKEVLFLNSRASPAKATGPATTVDPEAEALPSGMGAAADVPIPEGCSGISTSIAGAQSNLTAASPLSECSPVKCAATVAANRTTPATTRTDDLASERTCCRPAEAGPVEAEERPNDVHLSPSDSAPGLSTGAARPNAPMVLVVYRSDFPPPEGWRRSVETAAVTVAGGARITFMEIGETNSDSSIAEDALTEGTKAGERYRQELLETRLSRLIAGEATAGHEGTPGVDVLGEAAANEALGLMQWWCSVGLIAVYAKAGDPLERRFLRHLDAEGASRAVRTAFFAADSFPSADAGGGVPSVDQAPEPQWMRRYEWVERCDKEESSCQELPAAMVTPGDSNAGGARDGQGRGIPRLRTRIEQALFGVITLLLKTKRS